MSRVIVSPAGGIATYATVASASAIAAPAGNYCVVLLTGTTAVNTMTGGSTGQIVKLVASGQSTGVPVVLNHATGTNNLCLAGGHNLGIYARVPADTAASVGESVTFLFNGTYWIEIDRDLRPILDYVERTTSLNITATTEGTAQAYITGTTMTYDGATRIVFEMHAYAMGKGTNTLVNVLWEDSASQGLISPDPIANLHANLLTTYTPSNASHAYSWSAYVDAGTGNISGGAGGSGAVRPSYLKQTRDI